MSKHEPNNYLNSVFLRLTQTGVAVCVPFSGKAIPCMLCYSLHRCPDTGTPGSIWLSPWPSPSPTQLSRAGSFISFTYYDFHIVNSQLTWAKRGEKRPPVPGGTHYLACPLLPSLHLGVFPTTFPAVVLLSAYHHRPPHSLPPVFHRQCDFWPEVTHTGTPCHRSSHSNHSRHRGLETGNPRWPRPTRGPLTPQNPLPNSTWNLVVILFLIFKISFHVIFTSTWGAHSVNSDCFQVNCM